MIMLLFSILSCGTMNNPSDIPHEVSTLAKSLRLYDKSLSLIATPNTLIPKESETIECAQGGTIQMTNDYNQTEIAQHPNQFTLHLTSQASQCAEDGIITDGSIQIVLDVLNRFQKSTTTFITDFTIKDNNSLTTIKKSSSTVNETIDEDDEIITSTMVLVTNNSIQETIAFKTHETTQGNYTSIINVSGKKIIDGKTFIVDESFDHNNTPFVYDGDENLRIGGIQRYKDDQNHTIMMEVIEVNQIKVSVDKDGDGKAESVEVINL